jgi:ketosteroid isomerase-like protein
MSTHSTQSLLDRYFAAMNAEEDFSMFFGEDVTWTMVDSNQEVRGATAVRNYIIDLHTRMQGGSQRPLVVADGHAVLEGEAVNVEDGDERGLFYCLVYDLRDDRITAMRCYGSLARLMDASR